MPLQQRNYDDKDKDTAQKSWNDKHVNRKSKGTFFFLRGDFAKMKNDSGGGVEETDSGGGVQGVS